MASVEELSHTESQYSRRGRINDMYICFSDFLLTLDFSARLRVNLVHACSHVLPIWSAQVHELESVRPKCLRVWASEITALFIVNGGCTGGLAFLDIIIETVLPA